MPVINRVAEFAEDMTRWRQDFHMHPELLFEVHRTARIVAERLRAFGCDEVVTGIGRTGLVGVIHGSGRRSGKTIGLRADMDALPIIEETGAPYKSIVEGRMHACGHDGHTAVLLGAARYLCETRRFDGTAVVIFQPAEEGGGGGKSMVEDGLMERFGIGEVYGLHNMPGLPVGAFALRPGPIMAAADRFEIAIEGRGGHAARPHACIDPVAVGAAVVTAAQTIAARAIDPLDACVVSITRFHAGDALNVIPQQALLGGTVRALREQIRAVAEARLTEIAQGTAAAHRAKARIDYQRGYPVTVNDAEKTRFAAEVAREVAAGGSVETELAPSMGAEDFAYMLQARPGAYIFLGIGERAEWHHPTYDFNDEASPFGASYWARLVERALPLTG